MSKEEQQINHAGSRSIVGNVIELAPSANYDDILFRSPVHQRIFKNVLQHAEIRSVSAPSLQFIQAFFGAKFPPPDATGAALRAREVLQTDLRKRILAELRSCAEYEYCSVTIADAGWTHDWTEGAWDLKGILKECGSEIKKLALNGFWMPKIRSRMGGNGVPEHQFYLAGLLFEPRLHSLLSMRAAKLQRRLQPLNGVPAVTIVAVSPDPVAITKAIRKISCIAATDLPAFNDAQSARQCGERLHRMFQLEGIMPLTQLKMLDVGEGRRHMEGALETMKTSLPRGKSAAQSAAPRACRARDLALWMRDLGFADFEMPWLNR